MDQRCLWRQNEMRQMVVANTDASIMDTLSLQLPVWKICSQCSSVVEHMMSKVLSPNVLSIIYRRHGQQKRERLTSIFRVLVPVLVLPSALWNSLSNAEKDSMTIIWEDRYQSTEYVGNFPTIWSGLLAYDILRCIIGSFFASFICHSISLKWCRLQFEGVEFRRQSNMILRIRLGALALPLCVSYRQQWVVRLRCRHAQYIFPCLILDTNPMDDAQSSSDKQVLGC